MVPCLVCAALAVEQALFPALERLLADAAVQSQAGRTGVYDVTVRREDGSVIALFRGKSCRIPGEVIAGLQQADSAP
mgnify:CR=1 FL=1